MVAEVAGRKITLAEVDAKWQEFDAAERARVTQLLYQSRRNMLDLVMGDLLIGDAAKAANLSVEAYTEREFAAELRAPALRASPSSIFFRASASSRRGQSSWTSCGPRRATCA